MAITINHTIAPSRDKKAAARFFARIFGLPYEESDGHFAAIKVNDTFTLDYYDGEIKQRNHYAFHVSEQEFDEIFGRIQEEGIIYGSGPYDNENMDINHRQGGRGVYFKDLDGHLMELMTRA